MVFYNDGNMVKETYSTGRTWWVSAVTPAGYKYNLEILKKYIYRDMAKGLIDEWQLWLNTTNQEDIDYIHEMAKECDKIRICELPTKMGLCVYAIANFYRFADNLNTIYVRFDDDVSWVADDAVEKLVNARLKNSWVNDPILEYVLGTRVNPTPEPFVVSANIINMFCTSACHQEIGALGKEAGIQNHDLCCGTFVSPEFFELTHETFKSKLENNKLSDYYFPNKTLTEYQPFSINCFAFFAKDLKYLNELNEEPYIWGRGARESKRPNMICGDALVVHRAYGAQRMAIKTEQQWLSYYKQLSEKL